MNVIKPGSAKPPRKISTEVKPEKVDKSVSKIELPTKIEVKHSTAVASVVPGHVWRTRPFKWQPLTFATESEQLNNKFMEPHVQDTSLRTFLEDPTKRMIYGVAGNPDDSKAKYFAAYLVAHHMKVLGTHANVVWSPMYGGFDNPLMTSEAAPPTMLVMTNLTPQSTSMKLEKARDLIEKFCDIPRIVVIAGTDPMSFLATKLYVPIHSLAYFHEGLVKQKVEVI